MDGISLQLLIHLTMDGREVTKILKFAKSVNNYYGLLIVITFIITAISLVVTFGIKILGIGGLILNSNLRLRYNCIYPSLKVYNYIPF